MTSLRDAKVGDEIVPPVRVKLVKQAADGRQWRVLMVPSKDKSQPYHQVGFIEEGQAVVFTGQGYPEDLVGDLCQQEDLLAKEDAAQYVQEAGP